MNIRHQTIRKVIITGISKEDRKQALHYLYSNNYHVVFAGPMMLKKDFPYVETNKYKFIGEKRIK